MKENIKDLVLDIDIYPRIREKNGKYAPCISESRVEIYVEALQAGALFPPIEIQRIKDNGTIKNIFIDGVHRKLAYEKIGQTEIDCVYWKEDILDKTENLEALRLRSTEKNTTHGKRIDKNQLILQARRIAQENPTIDEKKLSTSFSVALGTVSEWICDIKTAYFGSRDAFIYKMFCLGFTHQEIADLVGDIGRTQVTNIVNNFRNEKIDQIKQFYFEEKMKFEDIAKLYGFDTISMWAVLLDGKLDIDRFALFGKSEYQNDKPQIYDVWNFVNRDPRLGMMYPGNIPGQLVMNILYYYTNQGDLVIDPMAGGGSTIDACLIMGRQCKAYDLIPCEERGLILNEYKISDIFQYDITTGYLERAKDCTLIFLDPPYFKKNEEDYGEESVSSLCRDDFLGFVEKLAKDSYATVKKGGYVAFLISNYINYENSRNSIFTMDLYDYFINAKFMCEMVFQCPLTTEQYTSHHVDNAKENKKILIRGRDLYIFKK